MYTSTILHNYIVYYILYSTLVLYYYTVHMYCMLQVANYMNGGHYNPHTDYVMREKVPDHVRYKFSVELVSSCSWVWVDLKSLISLYKAQDEFDKVLWYCLWKLNLLVLTLLSFETSVRV